MADNDSIFVLNAGPREIEAVANGMIYRFPAGKILEVATVRSGNTVIEAGSIVEHIMNQAWCSALVRYDFDEREEEGKDSYNRRKLIEGYHRHIDAIDKMIEEHNRMNDDRANTNKSKLGFSIGLRELLKIRETYQKSLQSEGEIVSGPPDYSLPTVDLTPMPVPESARKAVVPVAGQDGAIDMNEDLSAPAKKRGFRAQKVKEAVQESSEGF